MCRSFVQIVPLGAVGQCRVVGKFAGSLLLLPEFLQIHSHFMDDQAKQTARENGSQRRPQLLRSCQNLPDIQGSLSFMLLRGGSGGSDS